MEDEKKTFTGMKENHIEGRNAVLEAFRSGRTIDKLYVLDGCQDGPVRSITREARKHDTIVNYVTKERLDQISETGKHQGVIAVSAAYDYARVEDILALAEKKGEPPFILILDGIEDPHNLGAIIRTANQAGAHGVIIPKRRAVGLTPTVARTSAGAVNYVPVAKVTNISNTMKELKDRGMWFVCADMDGTLMYDMDLTGPIGLVIGNEGDGVSPLVKKNCDMVASIPMKGDIDSLNASVLLTDETKMQTATFRLHVFRTDRANFYMKLDDGVLHIACPSQTDFADERVQKLLKDFIEQALRHEARRLLPSRLLDLASRHGFTCTDVKIFNSKSHWGSCTPRRSINLSLSLMLLPWHLIDYVLLHELCHTIEMNHSDRFWALMDKVTEGKALELRKELKKYHML